MISFKDVCRLCEDVQNTKGLANKKSIFEKTFVNFREDTSFNVQENYEAFYQAFRLIVPKLDHDRKSYNMKEIKIARIIIKMLNLPDGPDKRNLLNYYKMHNQNSTLDFADIVHITLRKYISTKQPTVTVLEVNEFLDSIANRESETGLDDLMLKMFNKLDSQESKWVIRIMLKELKLGVDSNKILNIYHQDAEEYYKSNNNLKKVCEVLWNPSSKSNEFDLHLFEPFQPMLSKRSDGKSFMKDFPEKKLFFIENKFDGERFQLHMKDDRFKYFSRNGFDFTDKFGESFSSGILTPKLKEVFHENVKSIILDGEMMLWNTKIKKFGSKGMKFDVKKLNVSGYYQPCFCVFDILLLNDKVLRNETLAHRLKLLRKTFKTTFPGVIILSDYEESTSRKQIIDALNRTMDKEEEGIIVKEPSSIYKYRDRNSGWYKLKLEYFEEAVTDLDLILMGGYYKTNSRELNSFLVGVISDSYANVLSMGTVSSGLNFEEIEAVNKKLSEMGHPYDEFSSKSKGKLMFGKEVPDVWIEPEDSLVFTVRATELIRCRGDGFQTPYTLRFPRILNVRDDKPYRDCMSISELKEICQNKAVVKLNKRYLQLDDIPIIKRSKQTKSLQIDVDALSKTSNLLEGLKFYVLNGREDYSVNKIEMLIERFGGTFTFSLQTDVSIVLFGSLTSKVEELLKKENKFDVIKVEWLQRVIDTECIQRYKQDEVLSIGLSYYNCLADDVDLFGDSYIEEVNAEYMRSRLDTMALSSFSTNLNESVHFKSDLPLFNTYIAYFDRYEVVNDPSSHHIYNSFLDEIEFRYRKGTIADTLNPEVNLIVAELCNKKRKSKLEEYARNINCTNFQVIARTQLYEEEEL